MSDTQDQLVLRQRQMQQRQILTMMGIEQWVRPDSPTLTMASIAVVETVSTPSSYEAEIQQVTAHQPVSVQISNDQAHNLNSRYLDNANLDSSTLDNNLNISHSAIHSVSSQDSSLQPSDGFANQQVAKVIEPLVEKLSAQDSVEDISKIAPFDLQGGRYGDWVLVVDIQALSSDSQKLWQNITQALSISCETSSFPICSGMDTAELANASLAGYIFKLGRSEDIQVAALTLLPDGLEHPNFTIVPTLDEMLADSALKQQFWQQLSKPV